MKEEFKHTLKSFSELGIYKDEITGGEKLPESGRSAPEPEKAEKPPEKKKEAKAPKKEKRRKAKPRNRPYSSAEKHARSEIDRLGGLMVENRKMARKCEKSGDKKRAAEYREKERLFGAEMNKAKEVLEKIKNETVRGAKAAKKGEKIRDFWEKYAEEELERELSKAAEKKEVENPQIEDRRLRDEESNVSVLNLNEERKEEARGSEREEKHARKELEKELSKMPEKEREKVGLGLRNLGFFVEEKKNRFFSRVMEAALRKVDERGAMGRFLSSLGETFSRDAERARKKMGEAERGGKGRLLNANYLVGNVLKYGRVLADTVGYTAASPLRYVMAGGMFFARGAEAAKEARLKNEEVIEKTRVFDIDEAAEEAWKIYEEARGGREEVSREELERAYERNIPRDLIRRLKEKPEPGLASGILQKIIKKDVEMWVKRINGKIGKIEKDASLPESEKESRKEKIINKYSKRLKSFDRIVSQYGTVDSLAMGAQYAETGAKALVAGMVAETLALSVEKLLRLDLGSILGSPGGAGHHGAAAGGGRHFGVDTAGHGGTEAAGSGADNPPLNRPGRPELGHSIENRPAVGHAASGGSGHGAEKFAGAKVAEISGGTPESVTVGKGGNIWNSARELVKDPDKFNEAWKNSMVKLPGRDAPIHISKINLVHPGTKIEYVPGRGGGRGYFEIKPPEGQSLPNARAQYDFTEAIERAKNSRQAVENASFPAREHLADAWRGEGGMNYPESAGHGHGIGAHGLADGANHAEIPQAEIPGELVSQNVDKYFNVPSWTYSEFSNMKLDDFMALKDDGYYDVSEPWTPPWVDYDHDEFSALQEKITDIYKKLPLAERILEEKLPVEEFIKRNFEKIFPTGE